MPIIYQSPTSIPMTVGNYPQFRFAVFGDDLSSVTSPGYLNSSNMSGASPLSNSDVVMAIYNYSPQSGNGVFDIFTVNISSVNGQIVLSEWLDSSTNVMEVNAVNIMTGEGQIILAKANGTEVANAVTTNGNAGFITTASLTTLANNSYSFTWTNPRITSTSVISLTIQGGTNTSTYDISMKCIPGAGVATVNIFNNSNLAFALDGTLILGYMIF